MKIFGKQLTTKKDLKRINSTLNEIISDLEDECDRLECELEYILDSFPFELGQVVYDIALKDRRGRYTKTNPSFEHCIINEVVVDENNYFSLANRLKNNDVFYDASSANEFLKSICK